MFEPSKYQLAFFDWIKEGTGNAKVNAVAGSGKTTTCRQALKLIDSEQKVLFVAFNKLIATELQKNIPANVQAMTMHSLGWRVIMKNLRGVQLDKDKTANILKFDLLDINDKKDRELFYQSKGAVTKIVSLLKANNIQKPEYDHIVTLMTSFGIDDNGILPVIVDLAIRAFKKSLDVTSFMDFDDQIFMPVYMDYAIPQYDWVFIDELQDLNPIQVELVCRAGIGGRIVGVGDERQAIYGFRGADPESMANFAKRLSTKELKLNICYRCPKSVIKEAQVIVPEIEASDTAIEGKVAKIKSEEFEKLTVDGDYVLCRTTAPLVQKCLKFIREGRKAMVRGRDIGQSLIVLLENITKKYRSLGLLEGINQYRHDEIEKLSRTDKEDEIIAVNDRVDTLVALYEGVDRPLNVPVTVGTWSPTTSDLISKIESIFSDQATGIVFCTVHKAKGLEAKSIFIIKPEQMPHPMAKLPWQQKQEMNLKYVAITRSLENLYYVQS